MMQVSKRVPFEDPQVLMGVRILYVVSNLIIFGIYYFIGMKIKAKRGMDGSLHCSCRRANMVFQI